MNIIELAIEKIRHLSEKKTISESSSQEIKEIIEELNQLIAKDKKIQAAALRYIHLQNKEIQKDIEEIINEIFVQEAPKPPLVRDISSAVSKVAHKNKNKPAFTSPHPSISSEDEMYMGSSGREASLVSIATYKKLRKFQIEEITKKGSNRERPSNRFFTPESHPEYGLRYPVFLGANGEMIAIMRVAPDDMLHLLGKGAYSSVFLGMDIDTGKIVAVKSQMPANSYRQKILREKENDVRSEIKTMEELGRLVSSIEYEGEMIAVDELAGNINYQKILEEGLRSDMSNEGKLLKLEMALQLLEQIAAIHRQGYFHGDIKIPNMMLDEKTKKAKTIDFGLTVKKPVPPETFIAWTPGRGSPLYMSPEIMEGRISEGSEIYACGIALIDLLSQDDIFKMTPRWRHYLLRNKTLRNLSDFNEFFKIAAPNLFGAHPDPVLLPLIEVIKKMTGPENERPPLSEPIRILKQLKMSLSGFVTKSKFQS